MCSTLVLAFALAQISPDPWPIADPAPETEVKADDAAQLMPADTEIEIVGDGDVIEEDSTIAELFAALTKVLDDWRNLGWLAGLIAVINFLIALLRFKAINALFERWDIKWLKPSIAMALGGTLGGLSVLATGASATNSILAGCLAGLGSVGFHELIQSLKIMLTEKIKRDKVKKAA